MFSTYGETQNFVTWNHTHNYLWGYKASYRVDQGYVGPEAYASFGALFVKKNIKLGKKVNIYLGLSNGPWSWSFMSLTVNVPLLATNYCDFS
jgi:hypothetical protein